MFYVLYSNCNKFENVQCLVNIYIGFGFPRKSEAVEEGEFLTMWDARQDKPALGIMSTDVVAGREGTKKKKRGLWITGARGRSLWSQVLLLSHLIARDFKVFGISHT